MTAVSCCDVIKSDTVSEACWAVSITQNVSSTFPKYKPQSNKCTGINLQFRLYYNYFLIKKYTYSANPKFLVLLNHIAATNTMHFFQENFRYDKTVPTFVLKNI